MLSWVPSEASTPRVMALSTLMFVVGTRPELLSGPQLGQATRVILSSNSLSNTVSPAVVPAPLS